MSYIQPVPDDTAEQTRGRVRLPASTRSPWWELGRRLLLAVGDPRVHRRPGVLRPDGYVDNSDPTLEVDLVDAIYYTTVTLSTTGYGDIAPFTPARGWSTRSSSPRCASRSWSC